MSYDYDGFSGSRRMPFGKHKGCRIEHLPDSYLAWLAGVEDLDVWLASAVRSELRMREFNRKWERDYYSQSKRTPPSEQQQQVEPVIRIATENLPLTRRLIDLGYRHLAHELHPDHGGDTATMQSLNLLVESLRGQLVTLGAKS